VAAEYEFLKVKAEAPELDDGWWASVLADEDACLPADEEVFIPEDPPAVSQTKDEEKNGYKDWETIQAIFERDEIITLKVHACNRGGLLVHGEHIQGFVPISHLVEMANCANEKTRHQKLADYIGCTLQLKIIECEPDMERVVLSERAALAGEGRRKYLFESLKAGDVVSGMVTNITDFGAFIDLGGVEGLVHVSEISWGRVRHPEDILQIGEPVSAMVLQVSEENVRVALSLKRLCPNPWEKLPEKYKIGDEIPATVTVIKRFGVFARLEEGVEGLIHISSLNLEGDYRDLNKMFHAGQTLRVRIFHIDSGRRRLGLGLVEME
jgi:small subunit ribosomal protein S1